MRRKRSVGARLCLLAGLLLAGATWWWWERSLPTRSARVSVISTNSTKSANYETKGGLRTNVSAAFRPPSATQLSTQVVQTPTQQQNNRVTPATNRPTAVPVIPSLPTPGSTNATIYPRQVQNVFELQVALARQSISPGSVDAMMGPQTRSALLAFQAKEHLPGTGDLDEITRQRLVLTSASTTLYTVTSNDLARLQPLSATWLGKSQQTALEFETLLELLAERAQASPSLVRSLNPGVDFESLSAGATVLLPNISSPSGGLPVASLTIRLSDRVLEAWDENTNLLVHFPCSIARRVERRPVGELHVVAIAHNPNYTFDPDNFPESEEARTLKTKLVLPPGPNNPVGVAWIGLDKPGYGIHGTPHPEQVGRTESHGCFRLANWNAEYLLQVVKVGTPVFVQP